MKLPSCIKHYSEIHGPDDATYPGSRELHGITSDFSTELGLTKMGIGLELLPPGRRTSWPHAHKLEEEFIYVVSGNPQVWIDGELHDLKPGDGVAFVPGTGV